MAVEMSGNVWLFQCMDCEINIIPELTAPEFESPEEPKKSSSTSRTPATA